MLKADSGRARCSELDLRRNSLGDAGAVEIAQAIRYSRSVVHVDLSSNSLGPHAGEAVFASLMANASVTSLDVSSQPGPGRNRLGAKAMLSAIPVLRSSKILSILNIGGNAIRTEGLAYLAEGAKGNTTLESLGVAQNEISQCAAVAIRTLVTGTRLRELDLSDNPLGNSCVESIGRILAGSARSVLSRLYLAGVGVTGNFPCSVCVIANCVGTLLATHLESLRLDRNDFSGPLFVESIHALPTPCGLQSLSVNECSLGDCGGVALLHAIPKALPSLRTLSLQRNNLSVPALGS